MMSKIACIGNTNHFMLNIVRFLREEGYDAHLLLLNEPEVFQPEMDCFDNDFKNYTHQLNWKDVPFYELSKEDILNDLQDYNYIIGCDGSPAFVNKAGLAIDLFIPFGEDLYGLPFNRRNLQWSINPLTMYNNLIWNKRHNEYPVNQKEGIQKARSIFMPPTNKEFEEIVDKLNLRNRQKFECPSVFTSVYNKSTIENYYNESKQYTYFKSIRDDSDLMVFHHCRHSWKNSPDKWSYKANDLIFRGLADFNRQYPKVKLKVVLCEYGPDVDESKKLIKELDIENLVSWFPKLPRKEIMIGVSLADAGIGELGLSWLSYTALNEFLSMGLPVAHKRNDADFEGAHDELYPMHHAESSYDIFCFFEKLHLSRLEMKSMGEKGRNWYMNKVVIPSVNEIKKIVTSNE